MAVKLYEWSLRRGGISRAEALEGAPGIGGSVADVSDALRTLVELTLLRSSLSEPDVLFPVSPESAIAEVVNPIEVDIKEREQQVGGLKSQLLSLNSVYFQSRQARNRREAIDVISDVESVRSILAKEARACSVEVFSAHPGILSEHEIERSLPQDLELLRRGVRMRTLYQHPVRVSPMMRHQLTRLAAEGCEIRTCEEIPDRIVIFDREVAFIPDRMGSDGAVAVREPSTVDFLYRGLEQAWSAAVPFEDRSPSGIGYGAARSEMKRAIVRYLAEGAKDELIAHRLGISVRTCRRHIAEVMEELEASSRFQAGVLAMRAGLLDDAAVGVSETSLRLSRR
ncbi:helix-turn-helix transcriptional regulator [Streptomyces sp. NPDC049099]|uniref:helix-turn-helix transcriptional regulator n=1 Tax=unclassified Streptomyces TaxID=2593676 RepID=UPI0034329484